MKGEGELAIKSAKRCTYCGGTMWLDDEILKCFMCSRPAKTEGANDGPMIRWGQPKLPGSQTRSVSRRDK